MAITKPTRSMLSTGVSDSSDATFLTADSSENATFAGNLTVSGNLTVTGTSTTVDTVTMNAQNAIVFEGATADDHEITLTTVDPTADRTISLPNATGTLSLIAGTETLTNKTLTTPVIDTITRTGDFTVDASGDISLDADGEQIRFKDGGTEIGHVDMGSQNLTIRSKVDNKDIEFHGTDGGANVVALALDMSDAGTATFNNHVKLPDNGYLVLGAGEDLKLNSDGANSIINAAQGYLALQTASTERMRILNDGKVGIGTASPSSILEIVDSSASAPGTALKVYSAQNSAASDGLVFIHSDQELAPFSALNVRQDGTGDILTLLTDTTEVFSVTAAGTFGMGAGSGGLAGSIIINNDGGTGTIDNAYYNTVLGWEAADDLTSGDSNTIIGNQAGYKLTSGSNNTLIGRLAGENLTTGGGNLAIGYDSLGNGTVTGSYNIALGHESLQALTSGSENICMGRDAGHDIHTQSKMSQLDTKV